jgi:integrase
MRFLRDLVDAGAPRAITITLARAREPEPRTIIATPDELARLQVAAAAWEKCLLAMLAGLGLRRNEALRLTPANYDTKSNTIAYRTKGEQTNRLTATDELRAWFEQYGTNVPDPNVPLLQLIAGHPIGTTRVNHAWRRLRKKARVNPELRMHDLRRTVAIRVFETTNDIRQTQHLLGHRHAATTLKYLANFERRKDITPVLNELRDLPDPEWSIN